MTFEELIWQWNCAAEELARLEASCDGDETAACIARDKLMELDRQLAAWDDPPC
jgi:hypothetical protein